MKVSDIIKISATYLGKEEVINLLEGNFTDDCDQAKKDINLLINCVNLVIEQLSSEYVPFRKEEKIYTSDGTIYYKNLSERILEVCFVTNSLGEKVNFKVYPEYVKTAKGYVVIEYQYMPKPLTKSSEVFFSNNKLTERIIAYGVASEYALIENRFEESNMWDERFKQSLMVVLHPKNLKIKKRRWL